MKIKTRLHLSIALILFLFNASTHKVMSQNNLGLSISPPLFELMIKPGKEFKEIFTLANLGGDTLVTPKIVYFNPEGDLGNVEITENEAPEWVSYNKETFNLKSQGKIDFNVVFSPPSDLAETDHFLTLVFETNEPVDLLGQSSSTYKSRVGANILLTVSKDGNPKRSAEILDFNAPKVIDSLFGQIKFDIKIKNSGNSFWKPNGKITIEGFKTKDTLKLSPLNVLSGFSRVISCVDNENLIDCKIDKRFFIGNYKSTLEFSLDDDPKIYKKEIFIFAFPFSAILIILITLPLGLKIYVNRPKLFKKRNNL